MENRYSVREQVNGESISPPQRRQISEGMGGRNIPCRVPNTTPQRGPGTVCNVGRVRSGPNGFGSGEIVPP